HSADRAGALPGRAAGGACRPASAQRPGESVIGKLALPTEGQREPTGRLSCSLHRGMAGIFQGAEMRTRYRQRGRPQVRLVGPTIGRKRRKKKPAAAKAAAAKS